MDCFVSIIIVNWNGERWLEKCLSSLRAQTYKDFEIIFVDNASTDGSVEFMGKKYPEAKIVRSKENLGFAGGNNLGLKHAKGKYLYLLNNDTECDPCCIEYLVSAMEAHSKWGSVQSKIVLMNDPDRLDVCGSYWTGSSFLYHFGFGQNASKKEFNRRQSFFSNKGASMMIRKDIVDQVGLFDDDFWCYYEETDFCHRVWIAGYECWYEPKAIVSHAMGGTSLLFDNERIQFHNFKNKLLSFLKNFEVQTLIVVIPVFIALHILLIVAYLLQGKWRATLSFPRSLWWNVKHMTKTLKKRKNIKRIRKKSDKEIFMKVKRNPRWRYYYYLFVGLERYEEV